MGDGLGGDPKICVDAFVEAMRKTLPEDDRAKLDRPEYRAGVTPLGEAVFDIAVGPAQTRADPRTDAAFWAWIAAVQNWMKAMEDWAQTAAPRAGRPPPAPPPRAPRGLTGRIR